MFGSRSIDHDSKAEAETVALPADRIESASAIGGRAIASFADIVNFPMSPTERAQAFREREKAQKNNVFEVAGELVATVGRSRWILPTEFLEHLVSNGPSDDYTAKMVLDNLRSLGQLVFVTGKGICSPDAPFANQ